jgi:serine/threonine-protein kinase
MADSKIRTSFIANLALKRRWVTQKQLAECEKLQKKSKKMGLDIDLAQVLLQQGYISKIDLDEIRELDDPSLKGEIFGKYTILSPIGVGGMGRVFKAKQFFSKRIVAIKILKTTFRKEKDIDRFFREIHVLAKLQHPNIVTLYDAGKAENKFYYSMEFLAPPTWMQQFQENKPIDENEAYDTIISVAKGLAYAHENKIFHRDVKPENILIDEHGYYKITDFGVVMHKATDYYTLTDKGMTVGSPYYCSPEQAEGQRDIDGKTDIYSLGATFYHLVAGKPIYTEGTPIDILRQHVGARWVSPKRYNKDISWRTTRIIKKMMAKKREDRYQTMEELIQALEGKAEKIRNVIIALSIAAVILILVTLEIERNLGIWSSLIKAIFK